MEKIEYTTVQERTSIMNAKLAEGLYLLEDRRENEFHEGTREVIDFKDFLVFMTSVDQAEHERREARLILDKGTGAIVGQLIDVLIAKGLITIEDLAGFEEEIQARTAARTILSR